MLIGLIFVSLCVMSVCNFFLSYFYVSTALHIEYPVVIVGYRR